MAILIILSGFALLSIVWELFALAINYGWYWKEYRCRLEPWTYEWRRYVKRWWWVVLIKAGTFTALVLCPLIFPPFNIPFWAKIIIIVCGIIVIAFYSWLLLHLGGFAMKIKEWLWR